MLPIIRPERYLLAGRQRSRRSGVAGRCATAGCCRGRRRQKPLRRAFEQDPETVRRWLAEEYPAIRAAARRAGAQRAEAAMT